VGAIISNEHRALRSDAHELARRLGVFDQVSSLNPVPMGEGYLFLVPLLDALMRRVERLEREPAEPA